MKLWGYKIDRKSCWIRGSSDSTTPKMGGLTGYEPARPVIYFTSVRVISKKSGEFGGMEPSELPIHV